MNKFIALVLVMILVISLTSCSSQDNTVDLDNTISAEDEGDSDNIGTESEAIMQTGETIAIPQEYYTDAKLEGTIVEIEYDTVNYSSENEPITKPAYVYLPYGYDENDTETKYDTFYMMHGWTGTADEFFGANYSYTKNILDHMIENGDMKPVIVIAVTFDPNNQSNSFTNSVNELSVFHNELRNELVPAIESGFHTYEDREHRSFSGFSLGAVTTWYQFIYNLDLFKYYLPMSGDCWILGTYGGLNHPEETAEYLANVVKESGYAEDDFFIYAATGSDDAVFEQVDNQMQAMLNMKDDFTVNNFVYYMKPGGVHDYNAVMEYIYNGLPTFFE